MSSSQVDIGAGGYFSSQLTQSNNFSVGSSKSRDAQPMVPVTVKQLSDGVKSSDDKSSFLIDGVAVNVMLMGMTFNISQKSTDTSFVLDDGTGRIDCHRWLNDPVDKKEVEEILDGTYVRIHGHLKNYQGNMRLETLSIRPVTDYNAVSNHFLACIHYQFYLIKRVQKGGKVPTPANMPSTISNGYQASSNQPSVNYSTDGVQDTEKRILQLLASCDREIGMHRDEITQHVKLPSEKIDQALRTLTEEGQIYPTIDDCHYKSTDI